VIAGLEPQQRAPQAPRGGFADRGAREGHSRDRKFGAPRSGGFDARRGNDGYGRKPGFGGSGGRNEGFGSGRGDGFVPRTEGFGSRGESATRTPAFGKPAGGGKVFVARDVKKKPYKPAR